MTRLYRTIRRLLKLATAVYFVEIQASGREQIPADAPVIFAANHPNSIMDTVILGTQTNRQIHYMAKSALFKNPLVATLFDHCGVIPIHRTPQTDGASNEDAFDSAFGVLAKGGCIGIFPEGQNSMERQVLRIKTGTARIALGAEQENNYQLGVQIVPVGLNFENRDRFLSTVLVRFGKPIDAREYAEMHKVDERLAVQELTERLAQNLRDLSAHIEGEQLHELVEYIWPIYGTELVEDMVAYRKQVALDERPDFETLRDANIANIALDEEFDDDEDAGKRSGRRAWLLDRLRSTKRPSEPLGDKLWAQRQIADVLAHYQAHDPQRVAALRLRLWAHSDHIRQVHLRHDFIDRPPQTLSSRKSALQFTAYAIFFALPAGWGLVHNFVPYQLAKLAISRAPDEAIRAITGLLSGAFFFSLFYALYGAALWWGAGKSPWLVAGYLFSLIPTGFFFLRYRHQLARFRRRILTRTLFRTEKGLIETLARERGEIIAELDAMREGYREVAEAEGARPALSESVG
ncbi:lysophospholipid acyltransferase family protein [Bradymonas sediminis]|uniref:Uncharacterized protein n=1 Tax=Bradymonas sediminis TaxID=1548548 RepID=A0A2Z4FMM7_9DELT|nr:lysophospholipid acyltransferase family protein [Bradymonas sediminis]AWV90016.1 hypothetical protein DN745_11970 [Bradymonas sediminis]TDP76028.1 1-acyl-sn-glycerol-3-phosphate acyltransferase [Bradymonas sediminis]